MATTETTKGRYLVEGMTCAGCERTIQRIVGNLEGVTSAKADLSSSTVSVEYDSSKVTIDAIKAAINNVGYKFVDERPPHAQREGSDEAIS